eukprot:scaffold15011_cov61-Phaeocystis_antarctica.AAC.1
MCARRTLGVCVWHHTGIARRRGRRRRRVGRQGRARAEAVAPDPDDVEIDGLNPALPGSVEEHEKPLSTASAWTHASFFEAAGWRMQALSQLPPYALRTQVWLPPPQAGGEGGGGEGGGGDGGGGNGEGGGGDGGGGEGGGGGSG